MLPTQSRAGLFSALNAFFYNLKQWIAAEIVDDDPWDQGSLLSSSESNAPNFSGEQIATCELDQKK
jgi:hypothetical protein